MAQDFMGCLVTLDCGDVLGTYQGRVSAICADDQTLSIREAFRNGIHCHVPEVTLNASDIKDLQIIKSPNDAVPVHSGRQPAKAAADKNKKTTNHIHQLDKLQNTSNADHKQSGKNGVLQERSSTRRSNSMKQRQNPHRSAPRNQRHSPEFSVSPHGSVPMGTLQQQHRLHGSASADSLNEIVTVHKENGYHNGVENVRPSRVRANSMSDYQQSHKVTTPRKNDSSNGRRKPAHENCTAAPVEDCLLDDFDFEKNLALFDKRAVFEEIERDIDDGYLPQVTRFKQTPKYKCDENVLQSGPVVYRVIDAPGSTKEFVTDSGLIVPSVSADLRAKILSSAAMCGLSTVRQIEAIGRSTAEMALQLLGGNHRLNPKNAHQKPSVTVLCGPHIQGAYGINCARHLAEHGVNVIMFIPNFTKFIDEVEEELKLFNLCSGQRISDAKDLPTKPMDMILSAVDSPDRPPLLDIFWSSSVVQWACATKVKAPVLTIDPPVDGAQIPTKWSVSIALPLPLSDRGGQMYLVDLSIPRSIFKEQGVKYESPFGHKFMTALHPKEA